MHNVTTTGNNDNVTGHSEYRSCYVAFLDVLGFGTLVKRSLRDPDTFSKIVEVTRHVTSFSSGSKMTESGPCQMQIRTFSDSFVCFTPIKPTNPHVNPICQVLFLVRYVHDYFVRLGFCIRGGVATGKMYWHTDWDISSQSWNCGAPERCRRTNMPSPITFGPGLNKAYKLESEKAKHPRVLVSGALARCVDQRSMCASPFGSSGRLLRDLLIKDPEDHETYLDILHNCVERKTTEQLLIDSNNFTIKSDDNAKSSHKEIVKTVINLAKNSIDDNRLEPSVIEKYKWLKKYACETAKRDGIGV